LAEKPGWAGEVGLRCASPNLLKGQMANRVKGKRARGLRAKSRGGTGYPKTEVVVEVVRVVPVAVGTTAVFRKAAPRTAAQHSIVCVAQKVD